MKETKKSLKIYFVVVGILGLLSVIISIPESTFSVELIFIEGIYVVMSVMFIFYGVKFYDYLQRSPKTLINFVFISLGLRTILGLLSSQWASLALILLGWYLVHNVKKLSTQPSVVDDRK
ncbi:MAG: hypothetical protein QMD65_03125 [Patescibacteria group bacterium]|nr:hypothetical protein [Patescibacteria group bacterium]